MRVSALPAALVLVAAALAAGAAPAAADTAGPVLTVDLEAGTAALHHNTARVTYERVDGALNSVRIISVEIVSGERDCAWVAWNDPHNVNDWSNLTSEPSCNGTGLFESHDQIIKAPAGHPLKVRLAADHGSDVVHKDIEKL
ncbi:MULTISPECIES: hypothetical protein [unclassified Streptomyces]|uniref:hypothetical protein n=1 Tax=unclassified Streptomyces TaxID=2593676 RepID=UPI00224FC14B|nr:MULTISPECIES: hypothetical protein [unclassified Streptomyces]MCX5147989.1 hypothetical protein [Streptomyces sp. NBC_00320]WSN51078.1 hypothetical protein OG299_27075 [Streptomyces sp. NBC_01296]